MQDKLFFAHPLPYYRVLSILLCFFIALFWYKAYDGLYFFDDYAYTRHAYQVSQGTFHFDHETYSHRIGLIFPVAFCYLLFGVNEFSTVLWPLCCVLFSVILIYRLLYKEFNAAAAFAGAVFAGLDFYTIFFSNKLYPDTPVSFFILASVYALYGRSKRAALTGAIGFVSMCVLGFLSKETFIYILPFFALVMGHDIRLSENLKFWKLSMLFTVLSLVVYLMFYYFDTGDLLYRFKVISAEQYDSPYNYHFSGASALLYRLTYGPLDLMIGLEMIIPVAFALPLLFRLKLKNSLSSFHNFWAIAALSALLMFWFMSTNYEYYNPTPLFGRMMLFIVPLFAILAGAYFGSEASVKDKLILTSALLMITFVSFFAGGLNFYIYLALLLLTLLSFFIQINAQYAVTALFVILLAHPAYTIFKGPQTDYVDKKALMKKYLIGQQEKTLVITDEPQLYTNPFFYGFQKKDACRYTSADSIKYFNLSDYRKVYFLFTDGPDSVSAGMQNRIDQNFVKEIDRSHNTALYQLVK